MKIEHLAVTSELPIGPDPLLFASQLGNEGGFKWSKNGPVIPANSIELRWGDGQWILYARYGDRSSATFQQFYWSLPAASENTPIKKVYRTDEVSFQYHHAWNQRNQHGDVWELGMYLHGAIDIEINKPAGIYKGTFVYEANDDSFRGSGEFDITP